MGFVFTGIEQIIGEVRAGLWPCPWWLGGTPATTLGEVFQIQIFLLLIICRIHYPTHNEKQHTVEQKV